MNVMHTNYPLQLNSDYFIRPKLYDVLYISHVLKNVTNFVWERYIMSCFTKLSLINGMRKIN